MIMGHPLASRGNAASFSRKVFLKKIVPSKFKSQSFFLIPLLKFSNFNKTYNSKENYSTFQNLKPINF